MSPSGSTYTRCYNLHGEGDTAGVTTIQSKLREYGVCSFFNWDPRPPRWRFFYETNLSLTEIQCLLGPIGNRFKVTIKD
jgi:hypothetical protein